MGKFTVRFLSEGEEVNTRYYHPELERVIRYQNNYNIHEINKLKYEGEDYTLTFDLAELGETIDWEAAGYPNEKVKQAVAAIIDFMPVERTLKKLIEKIKSCKFENRYELTGYGEEAIKIIKAVNPHVGASHIEFAKEVAVKDIRHTLDNKEVHVAVNMKVLARTSQSSKNDAMREARNYLSKDIENFMFSATIYNF